MNILVDMNLPPAWVAELRAAGHTAVHWSTVGELRATDRDIMGWAADNDYVIFTHDLDFGAILAATGGKGPSVLQVRTQDVLPDALGALVIRAIEDHAAVLERGALVSLDQRRSRARILPLRPSP